MLGDASDGEAIRRGWESQKIVGYNRAWERRFVRLEQWMNAGASCAMRGDSEAAFGYLERALEARDPMMRFLVVAPWLRPLHADPRFADLARRMKLPLPKP
jgi:hypothetical protein